MKVTVTLASGHALELDGTEADAKRWAEAVKRGTKAIEGTPYGATGRRTIVCDLIAAITTHPDAPTVGRKR